MEHLIRHLSRDKYHIHELPVMDTFQSWLLPFWYSMILFDSQSRITMWYIFIRHLSRNKYYIYYIQVTETIRMTLRRGQVPPFFISFDMTSRTSTIYMIAGTVSVDVKYSNRRFSHIHWNFHSRCLLGMSSKIHLTLCRGLRMKQKEHPFDFRHG